MLGLFGSAMQGNKVHNDNMASNNNNNNNDDNKKGNDDSHSDMGILAITESSDIMEVVKSLNETVGMLSNKVQVLEKEVKLLKSFRRSTRGGGDGGGNNNGITKQYRKKASISDDDGGGGSASNIGGGGSSDRGQWRSSKGKKYRTTILSKKATLRKSNGASRSSIAMNTSMNMNTNMNQGNSMNSNMNNSMIDRRMSNGSEEFPGASRTNFPSTIEPEGVIIHADSDGGGDGDGGKPALSSTIPMQNKKGDEKRIFERTNSFGGIFLDYDNDSDDEDGIAVHGLGHDTYSLLKIKPIVSSSWIFAIVVIIVQMTLLAMILFQQINDALNDTDEVMVFNIPFRVYAYARAGQFFAIIFTVAMSRDIFMPVKELLSLWYTDEDEWLKVTGPIRERSLLNMWLIRILMPNVLQIVVGLLALVVSFVIIIQSDDVINLFSEFAAMSVIAELDNIAFWFAENGYAGDGVMDDVEIVQAVKIKEKIVKFLGFNLRMLMFIFLLISATVPMIPVIMGQRNGEFFRAKYPECQVSDMTFIRQSFGDGKCDGGVINTYDCAFDGGDCIDFNIAYPNCNRALEPTKVGDGYCDDAYNTAGCLYDGGDCCDKKDDPFLGDGICHAGLFHTDRCLFDGGDCEDLKLSFPDCPDYAEDLITADGEPIVIGNGVCDHGKEDIRAYMNEECGWVFGDCVEVRQRAVEMEAKYPDCYGVRDFWKIGDGKCDGGAYLKEECGYDEFDCCTLDHSKIGDGTCDSFIVSSRKLSTTPVETGYSNMSSVTSVPSLAPSLSPSSQPSAANYLNKECAYEGYDCCKFTDLLNNGFCRDSVNDGLKVLEEEQVVYNPQCGFDSVDCVVGKYPNCVVEVGERLGDGVCNGGEYNVEECGYDDGDCEEFNNLYPLCLENESVKQKERLIPYIGNGVCDKLEVNIIECGYDGGDCVSFNAKYPDCEAFFENSSKDLQPWRIGDGFCNQNEYNTIACGYDGGDCECENAGGDNCAGLEEYPFCNVEQPNELGDGSCRGDEYNTKECGWDGMDCFLINMAMHVNYPGCTVGFPPFIGDGKCHANEYNTELCGYDGGDCIEFNRLYPNCRTDFPYNIGNGNCQPDQNTLECEWDGGDCILPEYPECHARNPLWVGDTYCDWESPLYNTEECGWDGGDCINEQYPNCHLLDPTTLGNDQCDPSANTIECGWDAGDCLVPGLPNCRTNIPSLIGDSTCLMQYNTSACGFDGGDCLGQYPFCNPEDENKLGNGQCDSSSTPSENLNTEECGWDDGDCIIPDYPDCHVALPLELFGDDNCTVEYNTVLCGWDGGDCVVDGYPDCRTDNPTLIGDGNCTLAYNTTSCGYDGGDCTMSYPLCLASDRDQLGDGFCNTGYWGYYGDDYYQDDFYPSDDIENLNTEECGWDDGDCIIAGYPDCHVAFPIDFFGDNNCDDAYNTPDCGFDGGDCI